MGDPIELIHKIRFKIYCNVLTTKITAFAVINYNVGKIQLSYFVYKNR